MKERLKEKLSNGKQRSFSQYFPFSLILIKIYSNTFVNLISFNMNIYFSSFTHPSKHFQSNFVTLPFHSSYEIVCSAAGSGSYLSSFNILDSY